MRWCFTHDGYPWRSISGGWFCELHDEADSPCVDVRDAIVLPADKTYYEMTEMAIFPEREMIRDLAKYGLLREVGGDA